MIAVPDPTDPAFLKNAKPTVSFALPPKIFNLMKNTKLDTLLDIDSPFVLPCEKSHTSLNSCLLIV